jgi:Tol biopolymer transport system component
LNWQPEGYIPPTTSAPQTCLTLDSWNVALANPAPLPVGLGGKVSASLLGSDLASLERVYISNLDGSDKFYIDKAWIAAISPDKQRVIYSNTGNGLHMMDLRTGKDHQLSFTMPGDERPYWSPDGTQISFVRADGFYVFNADETGLQKVVDSGTSYDELGWLPDGKSLLFLGLSWPRQIRELDLATFAIRDVLPEQATSDIIWASISPFDGKIAFVKSYGGNGMEILYTVNADGSNLIPLARMGHRGFKPQGWSADGNWLLLGMINMDNLYDMKMENALVNPQTCEIVPLAIQGEIQSWVP